ncbi:sodium:alanine symporter family protein [bacterium]|nr:sodium:alanine symporter family protein [bacterium]
MIDQIFAYIDIIDDIFWMYAGTTTIVLMGAYFSIRSRFFQIRKFPLIIKNFLSYLTKKDVQDGKQGISPVRVFFAALGSCVGIGNLVGVCTAIQLGGPGAVFWMWVTAFIGSLVKYAEIYLGMKFRKKSGSSYTGGPIIYLQHIPGFAWLATAVAVLLVVYGAEIFIFKVITDAMVVGWGAPKLYVVAFLLVAILGAGTQGLSFLGRLNAFVVPTFLVTYLSLSTLVFFMYIAHLPAVLYSIVYYAFTPCAMIGGAAASSIVYVISYGMRRACYISDLGIGFASMIHSESTETNPARQASTSIVEMFLDTFILASTSMNLILVTGVWRSGVDVSVMVPAAIGLVFPWFMTIWPFILFMLGYATILAYYNVGRKAAQYLLGKQIGDIFYFIYATAMFIFFSFFANKEHAMGLMAIAGVLLLVINLFGIFKLRHEIEFDLE